MGERLQKAIGIDNIEKIFELSYNGQLKDMRENAIYCDFDARKIIVPEEQINEEFARQILLFAIESFDDNLVGFSDYSIEI